ncbi:YciI family protein [Gryllotalpicola reticulitermitis]|uniref:YciI family protein n=1 Tax=Gryllotalpicola reticulitermitis TaxID=1184153 RepID=A0ABV8Q2B1_9MICO
MTKYLISFPGPAMDVAPEELPAVADAAHAVLAEIKAAGVYVFGGGIDEEVAPVMVAGDGTLTDDTYPQTKEFTGGMTVVDVPSRDDALRWAAKIATACRCAQEVRAFQYDPLA